MSQVLTDLGAEVVVSEICNLTPDQFCSFQLIILGSPSWDFKAKEGQPHKDFFDFFEKYPETSFNNCNVALFGLGDRSYIFFCGAVDVLKEWVEQRGGQVLHEALRINRFYFNDPEESFTQAENWIRSVFQTVSSSTLAS